MRTLQLAGQAANMIASHLLPDRLNNGEARRKRSDGFAFRTQQNGDEKQDLDAYVDNAKGQPTLESPIISTRVNSLHA